MTIEIKNRFTGAVIYRSESAEAVRDAVIEAVKSRADLSDADLTGADLTGADLTDADLRRADLTDADLSDADLAGADLRRADLRRADLTDADLTGADLRRADLTDADLTGADLTGAPDPNRRLRAAERYRARNPDVPVIPDIDARTLARIEAGGELQMDRWHSCETTHCVAGWATVLAGERGRELEVKYGPARAGSMIYRASIGCVPNFYATNEVALRDLRARAEEQQAMAAAEVQS